VAFYQEKKRKLWIWIAIDRYSQEILGFSIGSRGKKAFKALLKQIEGYSVDHYASDE
jgi:IS1 family transposase